MNRKPVFDAVRQMLGRGFTQAEVATLDHAFECAEGGAEVPGGAHRLGALSERFESGGRGAGAVSNGAGDPGGVSYGIWQLASRTGTAAAFIGSEGGRWAADFAGARPGTPAFATAWQAVARRDGDAFADAQRAFIARSHYRPAVDAVLRKQGLDLDARHPAVRDAVWSVAVQHGGAVRILGAAMPRAIAPIRAMTARWWKRSMRSAAPMCCAWRRAPGRRPPKAGCCARSPAVAIRPSARRRWRCSMVRLPPSGNPA